MPTSGRAKAGRQRALVVGVGAYPAPIKKLPCVAADVRAVAKLLGSKNGAFSSKGVTLICNKDATRSKVTAALRRTLTKAGPDDTVFVYLAGHGAAVGGEYAFVAHDTDADDPVGTGVPLSSIRKMFDECPSHRAFLWLDFCHSGGVLARAVRDDRDLITRAIGVVQGRGKVILAACTEGQSAYEDTDLGHGLFTDALVRGLKGEAQMGGEVTSNSLFDFIDRQVGTRRQQPMYFGTQTGRVVLMHYDSQKPVKTAVRKPKKPVPAKPIATKPKAAPRKKAGTWVMLGEHFFVADAVKHGSDGKLEVKATTTTGAQTAAFAGLRPDRFGGAGSLPFAANTEAHVVRVRSVESESVGARQVWTLILSVEDGGFGQQMEMVHIVNGKTYTPEDVARLRAGRILLNDPAPQSGVRRWSGEETILNWVEGSGKYPVKECVVRSVFARHGTDPGWRESARLKAVFQLTASGVVQHVLDLTIGPVRAGRVAVKFRGRRTGRHTEATTIDVSGSCQLAG